jgi:uncharacterized protein (TIGR02246 family)
MIRKSVVAAGVAAVVFLGSGGPAVHAQDPTDGELRRLANSYSQAWAKGDAKALAGLYTTDAVRVGVEGRVSVGRKAIEQVMTETLTGPYRGTKIGFVQGQTTRAAQDAYVSEGTFQVSGGMPPVEFPSRGRYMHTLVRLNGRWLIAGEAVIGPPRTGR